MNQQEKDMAAAEQYAKKLNSGNVFWDARKEAFLAGITYARENPSDEVLELVEAVSKFIDKTQEVSKVTGENVMKAPGEYCSMLEALLKFEAAKGGGK